MKRNRIVLVAMGAAAAALVLLLTACDDEPTEEQAQEEFCDDAGAFLAALGALRDVDRDTPVEEFEDIREDVQTTYDNMVASAAQLREVRLDDLEQAKANLSAAVDDIDDDASLQEGLASIEEEADEVALQFSQVFNDANCGSGQGAQENSDE
jgi:hypothetical protein